MTKPNFMMIGVAKAGTTSFFRYLDQHPQIFVPEIKATNYFGYEDARDWKWDEEGDAPLLQNFPVRTPDAYKDIFSEVKDEVAVGEVSPQYFRCPNAARRIYEYEPKVKLVLSLRNPADRAFSGFMMRTRRGEAVKGFFEELTPQSSHVKEGFYSQRLKRYLDRFPREQIKIYIFEEFKKNSAGTILDLYRFLDVDTSFTPDTSVKYNPGAVPKFRLLNKLFYHPKLINMTKSMVPEGVQDMLKQVRELNLASTPKMPPELRAKLLGIYREDILRLEELLGRDLSIWRNGALHH